MYRFKPHEDLPRVHKVLGFYAASGRKVCLLLSPFRCAFHATPVASIDVLDYRVAFLDDIRLGGTEQLMALRMDICSHTLPEKSFNVITMLEVLEHIPDVQQALGNAVQLARSYVVVTLSSGPDENS